MKDYTGQPYVNVITHSLGVTLARKVIKGGPISADDGQHSRTLNSNVSSDVAGSCNIGSPLKFVDVFIGLSGGNYGLCNCEGGSELFATCNEKVR